VFVLFPGQTIKNQLVEVVSCEIVPEMHVAQFLESLSWPNVEQSITLWG